MKTETENQPEELTMVEQKNDAALDQTINELIPKARGGDKKAIEALIGDLLTKIRQGDEGALGILFEIYTDELKKIARFLMAQERKNHTLQPTALVSELYLRFAKKKQGDQDAREIEDVENPAAFLFTAMSNILRDYANARKAEKRGGKVERVPITEAEGAVKSDGRGLDPNTWEKLFESFAGFYPDKAEVLKAKYLTGDKLSDEEVGALLGLSRATVQRNVAFGKRWISSEYKKMLEMLP